MVRRMGRLLLAVIFLLFVVNAAWAQFGDPTPRRANELDGQVHMPTGRLMYSDTDISVTARGPGFEFTRHYTQPGSYWAGSQGAYVGLRWSHSYSWQLIYEGDLYEDGHNYISVLTGSGATQRFKQVSGANTIPRCYI